MARRCSSQRTITCCEFERIRKESATKTRQGEGETRRFTNPRLPEILLFSPSPCLLVFLPMQALLLTDDRKLELTDAPRPAIGPHEVLVRVAACGICGSDVHGYDGSSGRRVPPIIMGHEAAGVVEEVGE